MQQKIFRLTKDEINTIKRVAGERNCTQSDVIRLCISQLEGDTRQEQAGSAPDEKLLALLKGQLEIKDKQISDLSSALADAQATAKAAQALHAATSQAKALESSEQKKSRLQRLREAWRG